MQWSETEETWITILHNDESCSVRCSRARDRSFWFFFCSSCKRDVTEGCLLRGARIVARRQANDYTTDTDNDTESDSPESDVIDKPPSKRRRVDPYPPSN